MGGHPYCVVKRFFISSYKSNNHIPFKLIFIVSYKTKRDLCLFLANPLFCICFYLKHDPTYLMRLTETPIHEMELSAGWTVFFSLFWIIYYYYFLRLLEFQTIWNVRYFQVTLQKTFYFSFIIKFDTYLTAAWLNRHSGCKSILNIWSLNLLTRKYPKNMLQLKVKLFLHTFSLLRYSWSLLFVCFICNPLILIIELSCPWNLIGLHNVVWLTLNK